MVLINDPNSFEAILRAEGKYPVRDSTFTPGMQWFYKQFNMPIPLSMQ